MVNTMKYRSGSIVMSQRTKHVYLVLSREEKEKEYKLTQPMTVNKKLVQLFSFKESRYATELEEFMTDSFYEVLEY